MKDVAPWGFPLQEPFQLCRCCFANIIEDKEFTYHYYLTMIIAQPVLIVF